MKQCSACGQIIASENAFCPLCGGALTEAAQPAAPAYQAPAYQAPAYQAPAYQAPAYQAPAAEAPLTGLEVAIKIFTILGTISMAICTFAIALIWALPMKRCIVYKLTHHEYISTKFKIWTLIVLSLPAGIMLLCHKEPPFDPANPNGTYGPAPAVAAAPSAPANPQVNNYSANSQYPPQNYN